MSTPIQNIALHAAGAFDQTLALHLAATFMARDDIEGFRPRPYLCPAKVPTIGIGSTVYEDGRAVTLQDPPLTSSPS